MINNTLILFLYSVFNTRFSQLFWRLILKIKRNILVFAASDKRKDKTSIANSNTYSWRTIDNPIEIFPARNHLAKIIDDKGNIEVSFLNKSRIIENPINWSPVELRKGTRLWLLNLHYHEFLEGLPPKFKKHLILDWIENVKPYEEDYWQDSWNSYSLSIRTVKWIQLLNSCNISFNEKELTTVRNSIVAQLRFLRKNLELDIGGNHLIKNIKALLWGARSISNRESKNWNLKGLKLLEKNLNHQILPDGMHYELSPVYHNQVFADLMEIFLILGDGEIKNKLSKTLNKMAQVCLDFEHPDGTTSQFNDGGYTYTYSTNDLLKAYSEFMGEYPTPNNHIIMRSSGYYGYRELDDLIIIDCGQLSAPDLPAHGHGDALSIEWSVSGTRFLIDAGVYEYNEGKNRDYSRSTQAHNTVIINEENQSEFWKSFRVGRRANITKCEYSKIKRGFKFCGSHDGYSRLKGKPYHERSIEYKSNLLKINDIVIGKNHHNVKSNFLIHPDWKIIIKNKNSITFKSKKAVINMKSSHQILLSDALWHPDHGMKISTKRMSIDWGNESTSCSIEFEKENI